MGFQEGVLHGLLRGEVVFEDRPRETPHGVGVPSNQKFESCFVTGRSARDKGRILHCHPLDGYG
jgi:hypothetical protein